MIVDKRPVHSRPTPHQERRKLEVVERKAGRNRDREGGILAEVNHQIVADKRAVWRRSDARGQDCHPRALDRPQRENDDRSSLSISLDRPTEVKKIVATV